jgi:uncharacterized protein YukE
MNAKQIEEFATMKEEIKTIKSVVEKIDNKLDRVIECKLDKDEFMRFKDSQSNWYRWIPTLITLILAFIIFFRGL